MVDNQDRCEWMNVSSGTSSPGLSWTKDHKMVVVCSTIKTSKCGLHIVAMSAINVCFITNERGRQ